VRTPLRSTPWRDGGFWRPTKDGGAIIDLGDGFSGMIIVVRRNGAGYSGKAATFHDLGDDAQRAPVELWPTRCESPAPPDPSGRHD
jgi:hypothetical protein